MDLTLRNKVRNYLIEEYGLTIQPCSIPKNNFEYNKRIFYLWIKNNISENLFYILRDKIWPIKFREEREDYSLSFLSRGEDGNIRCEIIIECQESEEDPNITECYLSNFRVDNKFTHIETYKKDVDDFMSNFPMYVHIVRDKRLQEVLSNTE